MHISLWVGLSCHTILTMADFPKCMKALVKEKPGQSYEYKDVPVPHPNEGELLVKVHKVALCGTDIQKYKWNEGL